MNPFALAYREQRQLFLFDKAYLVGTLFKIGGLATLLARFVVQFFWDPKVAMALTMLLLALGAWMLWVAVRRSRRDWVSLPSCLIPSCFLGASLSDNCMHFDFLTALLLVQLSLVIFKKLRSHRLLWGALLTVTLYLSAGPAALVFAVCACLMDLSHEYAGTGRKVAGMLYPLLALACGTVAWKLALVPTWAAALTPAFHYDIDASMPWIHWLPWICFPIAVSIALFAAGFRTWLAAVLLIGSLAWAHIIGRDLEKEAPLSAYEYEHFTVNGRWDDLIASCKRHEWTPRTANYLNLALAHKGILVEDLFRYDQRGTMSLAYTAEDKTVDVRMAYIMFAMGNMAAAQNVAFNAISSLTGYAPAMLKMNAQIELMRGSYDVADKYLSLLGKAPHYRAWALDHRRFLRDDAAVEADPVLGNGRKDFPAVDGFAMFGNPAEELFRVLDANPADRNAMQYALSFLLLAKDAQGLCKFVNRYWGTPCLTSLPVPVQEALIFHSEYSRNFEGVDPVSFEWCMAHGVTWDTVDHFRAFQQASLRSGGSAPKGFRGTFWYYLLYTAI